MRWSVLAVALALALPPAAVFGEEAQPPIVAVMLIEAVGLNLPAATRDKLTLLLTLRLASSGRYQVVPREQVKKRLVELKRDSYRPDCDQSCQIELGQALAAQKMITTQVVKAGSSCTVGINVIDLLREASEDGAFVDGGCDETRIVGSLKAAVVRLTGGNSKSSPDEPSPDEDQEPAPGTSAQRPSGTLDAVPAVDATVPVVRKHAVKEVVGNVTVVAGTKDGTPVRLDLVDPSGRSLTTGSPYKNERAEIGQWRLTARAAGHEDVSQMLQVPPDEPVLIRVEPRRLGGLKVTGEPIGAAVTVTGPSGFGDEGGLPWEAEGLRSGTYRVEVSRAGYLQDVRDVTVMPEATADVKIILARAAPPPLRIEGKKVQEPQNRASEPQLSDAERRQRVNPLIKAGRDAYNAGNFGEAIEKYSQALSIDRNNALVLKLLQQARAKLSGRIVR